MANNCMYDMRVVGSNREDVEKFVKYMRCYYNYDTMEFDEEYHIGGRIFEAAYTIGEDNDAYIFGDCAWSVWSCMMSGECTYHKDFHERFGGACRSLSLEEVSAMLGLNIEVYGREPGMGFAEHYLISNGDLLVNEEAEYHEIFLGDYKSLEEFIEETGIDITEEEWHLEDYIMQCELDFDDWRI